MKKRFLPPAADLRGKTCVVTGATAGIGKEVARNFAQMGAEVVLACRDAGKGEIVRSELAHATGNSAISVAVVDLADQSSIRRFASALTAAHPKVHVLVNNAGGWTTVRRESAEGIERTFATNVLGTFLVTELLLPALRAAAQARVVNVASTFVSPPDLDDLACARRKYDGVRAYRESKAAERMLTWALARRLDGPGVAVHAVHPGGVNTDIYRDFGGITGMVWRWYVRNFKLTPAEGADTPTWAAVASEIGGQTGRFFAFRKEVPCEFRNEAREERLWKICEEMTKGSAHRQWRLGTP